MSLGKYCEGCPHRDGYTAQEHYSDEEYSEQFFCDLNMHEIDSCEIGKAYSRARDLEVEGSRILAFLDKVSSRLFPDVRPTDPTSDSVLKELDSLIKSKQELEGDKDLLIHSNMAATRLIKVINKSLFPNSDIDEWNEPALLSRLDEIIIQNERLQKSGGDLADTVDRLTRKFEDLLAGNKRLGAKIAEKQTMINNIAITLNKEHMEEITDLEVVPEIEHLILTLADTEETNENLVKENTKLSYQISELEQKLQFFKDIDKKEAEITGKPKGPRSIKLYKYFYDTSHGAMTDSLDLLDKDVRIDKILSFKATRDTCTLKIDHHGTLKTRRLDYILLEVEVMVDKSRWALNFKPFGELDKSWPENVTKRCGTWL
jgi:hypothetical protein